MTKQKIAPCPWCGGDGCFIDAIAHPTSGDRRDAVRCPDCGASGPRSVVTDPIELWNYRLSKPLSNDPGPDSGLGTQKSDAVSVTIGDLIEIHTCLACTFRDAGRRNKACIEKVEKMISDAGAN